MAEYLQKSNLWVNILILSIASLWLVTPSISQSVSSSYSAAAVYRPQGARPIGMAGAFTAISNDPMTLYYNPAGLSYIGSDPIIVASYSNLGLARNNANLAYAEQLDENWGIGIGITGASSDQFQGIDQFGTPTNTLRDLQSNITIGMSYALSDFSFGVAGKYIRNDLIGGQAAAQGFALDLGAKFNVLDYFTVGAAVQNIGGYMIWNSDIDNLEHLPFTVRFGTAMEFGLNDDSYVTRSTKSGELQTVYTPATRYVLVSLEGVVNQFDYNPNIILGTEAVLHELFALRGGIALYGSKDTEGVFLPMNIWAGGLSIRPQIMDMDYEFQFDYSISNDYINTTGINHNISIQMLF
jgi:hypothetical protein